MKARVDIGLHPSLRGSALLRAWVSLALVVSLLLAALHAHDQVRVPPDGRPALSSVNAVDGAAQDKDCLLCLALRSTVLGAVFVLMLAVRVTFARPLGGGPLPSFLRYGSAQPRAPPFAIA